jgi:hypothetical protein
MTEFSNDYLWDKRGEPDEYVRHLEMVLGGYRFDRPISIGISANASTTSAATRWRRQARNTAVLAAAAVILFGAYVTSIAVFGQPGRDWRVLARAGRPTVSGVAIAQSGTLSAGGVVETDGRSQAEIRAGRIGRIRVEAGSRVRLLATSAGRHRLGVDRGRIAARLWAPPFTFGFSTPSIEAFDVGCAFTMDVDDRGTTTVRVTSGWVQFERPDRQQLIPEGAVAIAEAGKPLAAPFFDDASPAFKRALYAIDGETIGDEERRSALATLLAEARPRDVYTLLQLNRDLTPPERLLVYDHATMLHPPPSGVTREGFAANNGAMLESWRRTLGFAEVKRWWIHWTDAFEF